MDAGFVYAPYIPIMFSNSNDPAYTIPNDTKDYYNWRGSESSSSVEENMSYVGGVLNYHSKYRVDQFFVGYNAKGKFEIHGVYRFTLEQAHAAIPHKHNYETH